ncbi:transglycosylase-like protein with SLT domain [Amycolatopsis sulphurea]|uniref:Transglycosylase-like protein with SLT domain n=1 Tax=Amycolatopsis sulphurea TaxID=76022 RepID=A0A2A9FBF3_9PSEU|nr:transglycosylase SLT domain-containing protein [Amycolatopsis sulphurea]PFG48126.1 transglycosylase-like protein with SLT domain [Amycolatopsis sulphurea]
MRLGTVSATDRVLAGALVVILALSSVQPPTPRLRPALVWPQPAEPPRPAPAAPAPPSVPPAGAGPDPGPPFKDPAPACGPARPDALDRWIGQAAAALEYAGEPPITDRAALRLIIAAESSGDPCVVNTWDANARRGTPSIGLVQTIRPTFDRWALPGYGDIRHPVDNIVAGVRYARARYGSESNVPGVVGRRTGRSYSGY